MRVGRLFLLSATVLVASCATQGEKRTIGQLEDVKVKLKEVKVEGGIEKAMEGYKKFLDQTPDSALAPEAMRRIADLKIDKEYGILGDAEANEKDSTSPASDGLDRPEPIDTKRSAAKGDAGRRTKSETADTVAGQARESTAEFEKRATRAEGIKRARASDQGGVRAGGDDDLQNANAVQAIALYKNLLKKYPYYKRNDQVLYQMSRAYEELGEIEHAMNVMNRIVKEYPHSRYMDEVEFRRGEYYFVHRKFLDAEDAYKAVIKHGDGSEYYELSLYKLGWALYKQELYEEALHRFIALLDHKFKSGFDLKTATDEGEKKRVSDTYRVISLSFSYLGGPNSVTEYFNTYGHRNYEVDIYGNLGEYYLDKRRYSDAAASYKAFVKLHPYDKAAPHFDMRVIGIYKKGAFPQLVIDATKQFVTSYGLRSEYWKHFDVKSYPKVVGYLKTNLKELANYYHARYQDKRFANDKPQSFQQARKWYNEFLVSFPKDAEAPVLNYQLADLLLENKWYGEAAREYERTAYDYPRHEKSAAAGYAAVYAYREDLKSATQKEKRDVKQDVIRSSLRFADAFPEHKKAALVLGAALEDIYNMKNYPLAVTTGRKLLGKFPNAKQSLRRSAWLIVAHSSYELDHYKDAEVAYLNVLRLTALDDNSRQGLVDDLAASIYKQGEAANRDGDYKTAAEQFLRVAKLAPTSKIRPNADYDAATALMKLKDWDKAVNVLLAFRKSYPGNKLQPEVTKKIAHIYQESGKLALAAAEYERIEKESKDNAVRREALQLAADLYTKAEKPDRALQVYRRYVDYFPHPTESALETRHKIAEILKSRNDMAGYHAELKQIVASDAHAGSERTDRTRYLAATASLVLSGPLYRTFAEIELVQPFKESLKKKKAAMKAAMNAFGKLVDYEVADVTAAATYYIAELYSNFSQALKKSERPTALSDLEMAQYEDALDEQSYPFEQKAIKIHEKNLDLMTRGIYDEWIDKSFHRLAKLFPGRYAKFEESSGFIKAIDTVSYVAITNPSAVTASSGGPKKAAATGGSAGTAKAGSLPSQSETPAQDAAPTGGPGAGVTTAEQDAASESETSSGKVSETPADATTESDTSQSTAAEVAPAAATTVDKALPGEVTNSPAPSEPAETNVHALTPKSGRPLGTTDDNASEEKGRASEATAPATTTVPSATLPSGEPAGTSGLPTEDETHAHAGESPGASPSTGATSPLGPAASEENRSAASDDTPAAADGGALANDEKPVEAETPGVTDTPDEAVGSGDAGAADEPGKREQENAAAEPARASVAPAAVNTAGDEGSNN